VPPTSETLDYDDAGNRQENALWDYGWDAKNQLVRARTEDFASAPQGWDIRFTYDAEGRRVRKHVIELRAGERVAEKEITFIWDGWDLLYERHQLPSGLTTLERKYLWGPDIADGAAGGAGGLLLIRETKGTTTTTDLIPLSDGTGHVVALTNLNKDLLATYAYGPFGEKISSIGPKANTNPWRWGTKYLDEETGLYYFGHRYYDPITGQFLSREPLGESESINLYAYAGNDPINNVDVQGLASVAINGNVTSSLELLSATLAKLDKPGTSRILDEALGKNADWVAYRQAVGMGGNFGQYIVGILTAHEGTPVRDLGLETRLRMWAMTASPSQLTAAADSGNFDTRLSRMLHDQSQAASDAVHDWKILSGTVQGATFIAQPETVLLKGAAAGILAIKGLSMADDALRIGLRSEGFAGDFARAALPDGRFYSTAFEMRLDPLDYGRHEKLHFNRANAALEDALRASPDFASGMDKLSPGILDYVSSAGGRQNPLNFIWHHDATPGIMRLVPTDQHTAGSIFWRTLHPDPGAAGGYSLWARPAGAPKR
jgi:RHS repeat-associated protein